MSDETHSSPDETHSSPDETHTSPDDTHTSRCLPHTLLVKFLAAVLMGLIVEALLFPTQGWEPVRGLKYLGEDVVFGALTKGDVHLPPAAPRYVFVNIDDASLLNWGKSPGDDIRPEITKLLTELRQSKASVIVVDIIFGLREGVRNPLYDIMKRTGRPVVAVADIQPPDPSEPMSMTRLGPNYRALAQHKPQALTLATPDLVWVYDEVRERVTVQCLDNGLREVPLPGIAEAVRQVLFKEDGKHKAEVSPDQTAHNCNKVAKDTTPIIFIQPYKPMHSTPFEGYLTEISASNATSSVAEFDKKIVVVGQTHTAIGDGFPTRLGTMPGVYIHLNSIMSDQIYGGVMEGGVWQELKIILIIVISVSAVYLLYWSVHERWINKRPLEYSPKGLGIFLLDLILFLIVTYIAIFVVVEIVKWQGTNFLQRGVIVGTLVPVLAVILEAAVELGRPTMFWLEELAEVVLRLFRHGPRLLLAAIKRYRNSKRANGAAALMLMMLVGGGSAFAAEQPIARLFPEHGSKLADFAVERQSTSGHLEIITPDASGTLFVGDVVRAIREGAAATVRSIATRASIARVTYDYPIKIVGEGTSPPSQPGMWTVPGTSYSANEIQPDQVRASGMLGSTVYDAQNRDIGSVKDLVIDKDGKVAATVIDVGTFLGMGGKYVAVPLSDLKTDNNRLTLDMNKEQLQQAQAYHLENPNTGAGSSTSPVTGGHIGSSTGTR